MTSFVSLCVLPFFLFSVVRAVPVDTLVTTPMGNFLDNSQDGKYQFIFHQSHHLMMAVDSSRCYFAPVREDQEYWLDDGHRQHAEELFVMMVESKYPVYTHLTTLDKMREVFHDLLADYHCVDKDVYLVIPPDSPITIPSDSSTTAIVTATATTTATANTATNSHMSNSGYGALALFNAPFLPFELFGAGLASLAHGLVGR